MYAANAQDSLINYDEAKIPPYTLPDPLQLPDGKRITSSTEWIRQQRPEMLQLFADNVYGRMPGKPKELHFVVNAIDSSALGGKAIRKQVTVFFTQCIRGTKDGSIALFTKVCKGSCSCLYWALTFMGIKLSVMMPVLSLSTQWAPMIRKNILRTIVLPKHQEELMQASGRWKKL